MAEPASLAGPLNQARHIGHGEGGLTCHHDPEVGHQGGERIVGDLGLRRGDRGDQARLASAREADQTDVSEHLEFQVDDALLTLLAQQREAGRFSGSRRQRGVPEAAPPAQRHHNLVHLAEVGEQLPGAVVGDHGARRHRQHDVGAVRAVAVASHTWLAVGCLPLGLAVVVDQGGQALVDAQQHRAAVPAVASIGPAERLELLAVHRDTAVSTVAGAHSEPSAIDEGRNGHGLVFLAGGRPSGLVRPRTYRTSLLVWARHAQYPIPRCASASSSRGANESVCGS